MGLFSKVSTAIQMIWSVGGNLRQIYEQSTDAHQQSQDRLQTLQRVVVFAVWVVAVAGYECYNVMAPAVTVVSRGRESDERSDRGSISASRQVQSPTSPNSHKNYSFVSSTNPASA